MGKDVFNRFGVLGGCLMLSACVGGDMDVTKAATSALGFGASADAPAVAGTPLQPQMQDGTSSPIIEGLLNRRSVLPSGPYSSVATAVLSANSRAAEADLRAAKLRAEARASNWLPTLGPNVSLTSLGSVVSSLVLDQVLFDNGRKRAERDYAKHDVEVAAVTLAQDSNDRVLSGLQLYLKAEQAQARAQVNAAAMTQMERYEYVMSERVKGGVSSRVDLQIVQQKLNQMRADMASDQEAAAAARSELAAMSAAPLSDVRGISALGTEHSAQPLAVMKARAEADRAIAEATAARAGLLPSLTASASAGGGETSAGLNLGGAGLGFGTGANMAALEQQQQAAAARVGQVQEDANRSLRALEGELVSLQRQEVQAQTLATQAASNFDIYSAQQREGTRSVPEVVSIFETKVRTEREAAALQFDVARVALQIAAQRGVLVDGADI